MLGTFLGPLLGGQQPQEFPLWARQTMFVTSHGLDCHDLPPRISVPR